MNGQIVGENLHLFAYTNADLCTNIRGVALCFHGLHESGLITQHNQDAIFFAQRDILYIIPLYGPWSWMNDSAVKMIDRVLDVAFEKYGVEEQAPIVSSGYSMGGLGAITFPRYSKYGSRIKAIAANCPVCDLIYMRQVNEEVPRTTYYAFNHYPTDMDSAVKSVSPVHNLDEAVRVPYFIAHCDSDRSVPKAEHSDIFVPELIKRGHDVTYICVQGRPHVDLDEKTAMLYREFIAKYAAGR